MRYRSCLVRRALLLHMSLLICSGQVFRQATLSGILTLVLPVASLSVTERKAAWQVRQQ